jgi:hypothetical protein
MQPVAELWRRLEVFLTSGIAGQRVHSAEAADCYHTDLGADLDHTARDPVVC